MPRRKTTEEFREELSKLFPNLELIGEYNGDKQYLTVRCKIHDYTFKTKPNWLRHGAGCQKCYDDRRGEKTRNSLEKVIEMARKVHGNKYDYSLIKEYKNNKQKLPIICPIHGVFYACMNKHISSKRGCPKCANKYITTEEWIERARKVHGDKYDYSKVKYVSNTTPITIICPTHGEFEQTPDKHTQGHGCPICKESKLEKRFRNLLKGLNNIEFNAQQHFGWLGRQSLDFHIPFANTSIECQGEQHLKEDEHSPLNNPERFKLVVSRDILKNRLCKENGVRLLYVINEKDKNLLSNPMLEGIYNDSNVLTIEEIEGDSSILLKKLYL